MTAPTEPIEVDDLTREKYQRIVRLLLAKAEDPACTEAEAATFTEKALDLMARYGVKVAMDAAAGRVDDPIIDYKMPLRGSYLLDFCMLLNSIGEPLGVKMIRLDNQRTSCTMHLFGPQSAIERVDMLFTSLVTQAVHGLARERPADKRGRELLRWRKDWLTGFTNAVTARLRAIEERANRDAAGTGSDSTAVVLADRASLTLKRFKEAYPRVKHTAVGRGWGRDGIAAGEAAGQRADLGQRRTGGGTQAITAG